MEKNHFKKIMFGCLVLSGLIVGLLPGFVFAEEGESESSSSTVPGTNISLTPVSKVLQIASNSSYEDKLTINNNGDSPMKVEVYAAPYSYIYSEEEEAYKLGFNNENNFTQMSRWITFKDGSGQFVAKPIFTIESGKSLDVTYRIKTPDNIPSGGQYAVIFAHTLTSTVSSSGIRTEASPGMVVYGRSSEGEAIVESTISDLKISRTTVGDKNAKELISASAKVKNSGNIDFNANGTLKVESIIGGGSYESPSNRGKISVIPEAELVVSDQWDDTPGFGIFKVTWTVTAGSNTETVEQLVFINPMPLTIITILLLTIIVVVVIIVIRRRKEHKSRLAV